MKTSFNFRTGSLVLVMVLIAISCSTSYKAALQCPPLERNNLQNQVAQKNRHNRQTYAYSRTITTKTRKNTRIPVTAKISTVSKVNNNGSVTSAPSQIWKVADISKVDYKMNLIASADNRNIPLFNPSLSADNSKLYTDKKAKKDKDNPGKTILRSARKTGFNNTSYSNASQQNSSAAKIDGLGLAGMIVGLVGLFVFGIPCGVIAMVFGVVSMVRIKKNPNKFRGKGFAIAAFIIGLVDIVALLILLSIM